MASVIMMYFLSTFACATLIEVHPPKLNTLPGSLLGTPREVAASIEEVESHLRSTVLDGFDGSSRDAIEQSTVAIEQAVASLKSRQSSEDSMLLWVVESVILRTLRAGDQMIKSSKGGKLDEIAHKLAATEGELEATAAKIQEAPELLNPDQTCGSKKTWAQRIFQDHEFQSFEALAAVLPEMMTDPTIRRGLLYLADTEIWWPLLKRIRVLMNEPMDASAAPDQISRPMAAVAPLDQISKHTRTFRQRGKVAQQQTSLEECDALGVPLGEILGVTILALIGMLMVGCAAAWGAAGVINFLVFSNLTFTSGFPAVVGWVVALAYGKAVAAPYTG